MIELTINLIHKFELILFMAVDFIDETIFKTCLLYTSPSPRD